MKNSKFQIGDKILYDSSEFLSDPIEDTITGIMELKHSFKYRVANHDPWLNERLIFTVDEWRQKRIEILTKSLIETSTKTFNI